MPSSIQPTINPTIRPAIRETDQHAIWDILEPIIRAGETYPLPQDMAKKAAIAFWMSSLHQCFVAEDGSGKILGTYYMRPNLSGRGAHIANCGYMVAQNAQGQGIARAMCNHSIEHAAHQGFEGIQFNFVICSNLRAIELWTKIGFLTIGRLPKVYDHPTEGKIDALIMFMPL